VRDGPGEARGIDQPATARPIAISKQGMPFGLQIVGPFMEDRTTLRFAALLDDLFGGFTPPPIARDAR
jgi:amidase